MPSSFLRSPLPCLLAALIASALSAVASAQSLPEAPYAAPSAEPWSAPHFSIDPKTLYQAASAAPAPDGVNVTELCDDESYTFDDAGRMVHVGHLVYKVLTQKGAEVWDSLSVGWEPWHEARPVIRARVIAPDFTVHTLDPNTITEAPARGGDYKTYSDGKRLHAPLPAIAPGVVVEEEYTETETETLFRAGRVGRDVYKRQGGSSPFQRTAQGRTIATTSGGARSSDASRRDARCRCKRPGSEDEIRRRGNRTPRPRLQPDQRHFAFQRNLQRADARVVHR